MKSIFKITLLIGILHIIVFLSTSSATTLPYNFSNGLGNWHVEDYQNIVSPWKNNLPYIHICGIGINDDASLSMSDLKIDQNGYIDIETELLGNYSNVPAFFGYFNLRSISSTEELIVQLYLKTGSNFNQYFGETLTYSVGNQLLFDSYPLSEPWHRLTLDTQGITNLDDVRAFGFRIYTTTGYGLNTAFYNDGHLYNGTSWRKFHFDNPGYVPEPGTFVLLFAGVLFIGFVRWFKTRNK